MDLWDGDVDFVINSCKIRTKVIQSPLMYNLITTMTLKYICDMQIYKTFYKPSTHLVTYVIVKSKSNRRLDCNRRRALVTIKNPNRHMKRAKTWSQLDCDRPSSTWSRQKTRLRPTVKQLQKSNGHRAEEQLRPRRATVIK